MKTKKNHSSIFVPSDLNSRIESAINYFWLKRTGQSSNKTIDSNISDNNRSAVVGGKQLDGFLMLIKELLIENQVDEKCIYTSNKLELPGYFRPCKKWDLVVVEEQKLLVVLETKSQVGPSFGNNFNNRTEEAMGSALDIWTAYRENVFQKSSPWLGYLMLLEDCEKSRTPVSINSPHFAVMDEFIGSSYIKRYELFCKKLMFERKYNYTCLLTSQKESSQLGNFNTPCDDLSFHSFILSMLSSILAHRMVKGMNKK